MEKKATSIDGVYKITPQLFGDARGFFIETYRRQWFPEGREMIQGNRADRQKGSVVGFHYHLQQADYWYVPFGRCRVILHDLREGSPTEGVTEYFDLGASTDNDPAKFDHSGIYIPPGVAHSFVAVTDMTITYLVDSYYNTNDENGVYYLDPSIKADWGVENPIVSDRDKANPLKKDIPELKKAYYGIRN